MKWLDGIVKIKDMQVKNALLCFIILFLSIKIQAQTRPNVVRDGGQWDFYHIGGYPSALGVTSFYTLGTDTVIEAQTYKKVLCREKVDTAEEKPCPWGLREDEKRLYLYDYTTQKEHVLCDFSLRPGDTLVTDWPWVPPIFVVEKVGDTILPGGDTPLRYLAVRDARHHGADIWVEKIGPLHYGISWGYLWMAAGVINELLCYSDNGNMCYQNPTYKNCYIHYDTGTFRGKIVSVPAPFFTDAYTEGKNTFGLKIDTVTYILAPMHIGFETFTFKGEKYAVGDSVEVRGKIYNSVDDAYEEFLMLSVQSIRKFESVDNQTTVCTGRVYYEVARQSIMIEDDMKIDRLEVFDAQGRGVMTVDRPAGSVSVARLPHGLYLYRLTAAGTTRTGKFVR